MTKCSKKDASAKDKEKEKLATFVKKRKTKLGRHDGKGTAKMLRAVVQRQIRRDKKMRDVKSTIELPEGVGTDQKDENTYLDFLADTERYLINATSALQAAKEVMGLRCAALYAAFTGKVDLEINGDKRTGGGAIVAQSEPSPASSTLPALSLLLPCSVS